MRRLSLTSFSLVSYVSIMVIWNLMSVNTGKQIHYWHHFVLYKVCSLTVFSQPNYYINLSLRSILLYDIKCNALENMVEQLIIRIHWVEDLDELYVYMSFKVFDNNKKVVVDVRSFLQLLHDVYGILYTLT